MNPVGSNFQVIVFHGLLPGDTPIGRNPADINASGCRHRRLRSLAEEPRCAWNGTSFRPNTGDCQHGIPADSSHVLRQAAINEGGCRGRAPNCCPPRETPSRSAVPKVFHGRIVVERDSVGQVLAEKLGGIGVADVGVVPGEMVVLASIGHLNEAADVRGPSAGQKERGVLGKLKTAVLSAGLRSTIRGSK